MGIGSANPLLLASAAADSDPVTRSLRFNDDDTAHLSRTFSSAGDGQKYTISMWVKLGDKSTWDVFISAEASSGTSDQDALHLDETTGKLIVQLEGIGQTLKTTRELRDSSGWYHLCFYLDTTQSSASDRLKLFINGVEETSFDTDSRSSITVDSSSANFNTAGTYRIGNSSNSSNDLFNGYIADVYFIDGAAVSPVGNFIEDTGYNSYKPKAFDMSSYSGNSFHLKFEETGVGTGDSDTVGADSSGQDNHFDSSGIVASDVLLDTPNKNYATLNPTTQTQTSSASYDATVTGRITEGNLKLVAASASYTNGHGTLGVSSGKWYFEWFQDGDWVSGGWGTQAMFSSGTSSLQYSWVADAGDVGNPTAPALYYPSSSGGGAISGNTWGSGTLSPSDRNIYGCAFDVDNLKMYFMRGGYWWDGSSWVTTFPSSYGGDKTSSQHLPSDSTFIPYIRAWLNSDSGETGIANFGQDPTFAGEVTTGADTSQSEFYYAPPEGFKALCSANFDDPTVKAHENFNTVIYTGDGNTDRSISGAGFQPDLTWIKNRDTSTWSVLHDSLRGSDEALYPPGDDAGGDHAAFFGPFQTDGFKVAPTSVGSQYNTNTDRYVAWNWKENAIAGFDIVKWAGDSNAVGDGYSEQTVEHDLNVAPEMIIAKARTDNNISSYGYEHDWCVYHKDLTSGYFIKLNETDSELEHDGALFSAIGTSSLDFGNDTYDNQSLNYAESYSGTEEDYVAYLFASVDGVCKVGSYTGTGVADGAFVYTGFRPAFVMGKRKGSGGWFLWDNKRGPENVINNTLYPHSSAIESGSGGIVDFTANGFKIRYGTGTDYNGSDTIIYLAMAESPLKYANAR